MTSNGSSSKIVDLDVLSEDMEVSGLDVALRLRVEVVISNAGSGILVMRWYSTFLSIFIPELEQQSYWMVNFLSGPVPSKSMTYPFPPWEHLPGDRSDVTKT
jgi:hypothetical protein